jgi:hypothetical protein
MRARSLLAVWLLCSCGQKATTEKKPENNPPKSPVSTPATVAVSTPTSVPTPVVVVTNLEAKKIDGPYADEEKQCAAMKEQAKNKGACRSGEDYALFEGATAQLTKEPYDAQIIELINEDEPANNLFLRVSAKGQRYSYHIGDLQPMMMAAGGGSMSMIKGKELKVEDMIPGGAPELIFSYQEQMITRGEDEILTAHISYLLLCGLGASGVPSCLEPLATEAQYWFSSDDKEPAASSISSWKFAVAVKETALEISAPELKLVDVRGLTQFDDDPSQEKDEEPKPGPSAKEDFKMKDARVAMEKRVCGRSSFRNVKFCLEGTKC